MGHVSSRSSTAGWSIRGPRTRSRAGWIWVSSPRIRLDVAVICCARSSSNPDSTVSSAFLSSSSFSGPQGVRHGAGRVGDDGGIAGICLGRPGVQIGDAAHRQARQVGHRDALVQGHRDPAGRRSWPAGRRPTTPGRACAAAGTTRGASPRGAGEDAYGVRVVVVPGDRQVVQVRGPGVGVAGVAGEVGDRVAELFVARPAEPDGPDLA